MQSVDLTFIVPVYNTEKYILRCLNSLNSSKVKIIAINDGSTDNTAQILDDFAAKNPNCKVIHTENRGASSARLTGLKQVETDFFSFVDSDDYINLEVYLELCQVMKYSGYPVGNGRMSVYLPNFKIPINSRKWKKEKLDFLRDKSDFANTTCPLWGKIWRTDCAYLFQEKSTQIVYEDLEFVYYVLANQRYMFHTNDIMYNYCMRNNSTSALGLERITNKGLKGLLDAATSMKEKFRKGNLLDEYEIELNAIIIKLFYQRIRAVINNKNISNKKEMVGLMLNILDNYISDWRYNEYFLENFKGCEYDDAISYKCVKLYMNLFNIYNSYEQVNEDYNELLESYNRKIVLK